MPRSLHPLAEALNADLARDNCLIPALLSRKGQRAYFPSKGILGQSAEAQDAAINATIGTAFEEDGTPLCLECVEQIVNLPATAFLYASSFGLQALREQWRSMLIAKNPSLTGKTFSLPIATNALTHGLSVTGQLFVDEDDEVILPDLHWDNYKLLFEEGCGGRLATFPMFADRRFNVAGLRDLLAEPGEKKIVLLNFPNNPTGYTPACEDVVALCAVLLRAAEAGKRMVVILDDAYFGLVYEPDICAESLFTHLVDLHPNVLAVKLDAPTKEDYAWGLRVGFATFGGKGCDARHLKAMEAKCAGMVRGSISNVSCLGQHVLLKAYRDPAYGAQKQAKFELLKQRYLRIKGIFEAHPEYEASFCPMPFNSGYFMCVKTPGVDPEAVRRDLLDRQSTGVLVVSGLIRIAFSSVALDALEILFANLHKAVQHVKMRDLALAAKTRLIG